MTKFEFLLKVPDTIEHKTLGFSELEIISDKEKRKGVCYRHKNKTASYNTYGSTWFDVYIKLSNNLIKEGYIKNYN
jgi:hypothetical protein